MYVIKRNGKQVIFDKTKIAVAVSKANKEVLENKLSDDQINNIADTIESRAKQFSRALNIEEIQDMVENLIMYYNKYEVAKAYVLYRYKQKENRDNGNLFNKVNAIVNNEDEETKQENSNKDPDIISVQRDYIAGEVSKAMVRQEKYPKYIMDAHDAGLIHIHDCDYKICKETNCCLVNAEDMLQNGTVISKTKIDTPHSFSTASNIETQIMAQVASSQYGGQSISLYHLVPFVEISRQAITKSVEEDHVPDEYKQEAITRRLKKEINKGVQTIQYQVSTLMTTNGQAPFITLFMYLNEAETEQEKEDLALIIEEVLKQRLQGVKNSDGVWVTPAFPKLIYVLEDDNTDEGSKYFYLTELAAKCTAKRMVPDYSSERKIIEAKYPTEKLLHIKDRRDQWGDEDIWGRNVFKNVTDEECDKLQEIVDNRFNKEYVIPDEIKDIIKKYGLKMADITPKAILPMGCLDAKEVVTYTVDGFLFVESFDRFWDRMASMYMVKSQDPNTPNLYIDLDDRVKIYDMDRHLIACRRIIRNVQSEWVKVKLSNGRQLDCTIDHPFTTNRGRVLARDLIPGSDIVPIDCLHPYKESIYAGFDKAWLLGFFLCDGAVDNLTAYIGMDESDIQARFINAVKNVFGCNVTVTEQHRGVKGNYKELKIIAGDQRKTIIQYLLSVYEGRQKAVRHIPNEVFNWSRNDRIAFLAGMIDADGYINNNPACSIVQLGSTNKELAIQQMLLAQSLHMFAHIYENHYSSAHPEKIRYRVEFAPITDLVFVLSSGKKMDHYNYRHKADRKMFGTVVDLQPYTCTKYSYDVTTESDYFTVSGVHSHNCRSFLTPDFIHYKRYGRFNQGVCTINLVDVALSSQKNMDDFWKIFDERLQLCYEALMIDHNYLLGTKSDVAPMLWQYGALARLKEGETIDKLLVDNYSTISLGYAGLCECVKYMTGKSHTDPEAKPFALSIMKHLNSKCDEWRAQTNISFSVYGTPLESTTYTFAKALQKRFGIIKDVTDHNYITNSYHCSVREQIDAFTKLKFESEFQELSPGGAISYVEVPNMQNNIKAVISVIQFIANNIMYAELNTKSDYCYECGYDGEIQIVEDDNGKLVWECPKCHNRDQHRMSVARRSCGYIGTNFWNQGRTQEIKDRVLHL